MVDEPQDTKEVKIKIEGKEELTSFEGVLSSLPEKFEKGTEASNKLTEAAREGKEIYEKYSSVMHNMIEEISSVNRQLNYGEAITHKQASAIATLSASLMDSNKLFNNFGNGINLNNVHTFTEQFEEFESTVKKVIDTTKNLGITDQASALLRATGMNIPLEVIAKGGAAITSFAKANFAGADAAIRLREAILQTAAATGNLDKVYSSSGENLQNINNLIAQNTEIINKSELSTNLAHKDVIQYFAALSKVPNMMSNVISTSDEFGNSLSMLSATIRLAQGTNKDYFKVVDDITKAYRNYNITGEKALDFSARMTEVSSKLGIELEFVENFIEGASQELGKFGNNTDASAKILLNYAKGLREVGASGMQSVSIVKEMESNITKLTMSQKAFLSAQSGGPGGIMGALRIEKLLKEGKSDEVFEMMRKQLTKQFGKIVTLDEATTNAQSAAQFQRQRQLLMKGPLGSIVKSEGDANRVLEMFKNMQSGSFKKESLDKNAYENYIKKGRQLSEQTQTPFGMQSALSTQIQTQLANKQLENVQRTFALSSGRERPEEPDYNQSLRSDMRGKMLESNQLGSTAVSNLNEDYKQNNFMDRLGMQLGKSAQQSRDFITKSIPKTVIAPFNTAKSIISEPTLKSAESQEKQLKIIQEQEKSKIEPQKQEKSILNRLTGQPSEQPSRIVIDSKQEQQKEKPKDNPLQAQSQEVKHKVDVNVTGICLECSKKITPNSHVHSVNPSNQ